MAKSALHPQVEARPSPLKGAFKKTLCAFFTLCAAFLQRTHNAIHPQTTRIQPVARHTTDSHSVEYKQLETAAESTFTDAITRDKLPEASPKGPGTTHLRALAGQRSKITERTLVTQGLASRPPKPKIKQTTPEKTTPEYRKIITQPPPYSTLIKSVFYTRNSPHRSHAENGGGRRTPSPTEQYQDYHIPTYSALPKYSTPVPHSKTHPPHAKTLALSHSTTGDICGPGERHRLGPCRTRCSQASMQITSTETTVATAATANHPCHTTHACTQPICHYSNLQTPTGIPPHEHSTPPSQQAETDLPRHYKPNTETKGACPPSYTLQPPPTHLNRNLHENSAPLAGEDLLPGTYTVGATDKQRKTSLDYEHRPPYNTANCRTSPRAPILPEKTPLKPPSCTSLEFLTKTNTTPRKQDPFTPEPHYRPTQDTADDPRTLGTAAPRQKAVRCLSVTLPAHLSLNIAYNRLGEVTAATPQTFWCLHIPNLLPKHNPEHQPSHTPGDKSKPLHVTSHTNTPHTPHREHKGANASPQHHAREVVERAASPLPGQKTTPTPSRKPGALDEYCLPRRGGTPALPENPAFKTPAHSDRITQKAHRPADHARNIPFNQIRHGKIAQAHTSTLQEMVSSGPIRPYKHKHTTYVTDIENRHTHHPACKPALDTTHKPQDIGYNSNSIDNEGPHPTQPHHSPLIYQATCNPHTLHHTPPPPRTHHKPNPTRRCQHQPLLTAPPTTPNPPTSLPGTTLTHIPTAPAQKISPPHALNLPLPNTHTNHTEPIKPFPTHPPTHSVIPHAHTPSQPPPQNHRTHCTTNTHHPLLLSPTSHTPAAYLPTTPLHTQPYQDKPTPQAHTTHHNTTISPPPGPQPIPKTPHTSQHPTLYLPPPHTPQHLAETPHGDQCQDL